MKLGILLTNTGTPSAPTTKAVRQYLREFLTDPRVVQLPRLIWLPILHSLVLTTRPRQSAKLYQSIWTEEGSPQRVIMQHLAVNLKKKLTATLPDPIEVEIGMHYGKPSIQDGLENLRQKNVEKIIVIPLYPQYSNATTASTFDRVTHALKKWPALPAFSMVRDYATHPLYIAALANSIQQTQKKSAYHLLISFHGIPERMVKMGDPYAEQCHTTANLVAQKLNLTPDQWTICFQSRFGYAKWLTPSTQSLLEILPKRGIEHIDIICPGFATDCLETLEEINIRGRESFLIAGGKMLRYIPALNDSKAQVEMLMEIIQQ